MITEIKVKKLLRSDVPQDGEVTPDLTRHKVLTLNLCVVPHSLPFLTAPLKLLQLRRDSNI